MKIQVILDIKTNFVVSDTGYTRNMTLPEIEKWANDKARTLTIHIQEGGTDPKPVRSEMTIRAIHFVPEGSETQ
jgi:hypothetical protein